LPLYFPEAERYFHSSRSQSFPRLMIHFPTPASILRYEFEDFVESAWEIVGRKVNKRQWLYDLYCTARESIALPVEEDSLAIATFRMVLRQYLDLNQLRHQLESIAEQQLSDHADYQRLKTLPGVGPIIALTILAEAGNLRRFRHHRQFLKFCGFDLATYQSGSSRGQTRLSKRGNARLRQAFWMAATIAIRQRENSFRRKYENYIRRDPTNADLKRKAYTAVAAKMARVAYALVKHQTQYRCYHEAAIPSGKIPFNRAVGACRTP
jgi:transposase